MTGATHRYDVRIYFEDTDAGGIVYHANYFRFAERARTEAMRDAGMPHAELVRDHGLYFVVRRIKMDYVRPARLDDVLTVETESLALRGATTRLRQTFRVGAERIAEMEIELACVRLEDGRPARIPDRWRHALEADAAGPTDQPRQMAEE
jgi:acyl-CoA thioester hydrolase